MSKTIGDRIKDLRTSKDMTLEDLGKLLNVTPQTIFKYEKGIITNIPLKKVRELAKIFDVTEKYLMGWDTELYEYKLSQEQAMLIYGYNAASEELKDAIFRILNMIRPNGEHSDDKSSLL